MLERFRGSPKLSAMTAWLESLCSQQGSYLLTKLSRLDWLGKVGMGRRDMGMELQIRFISLKTSYPTSCIYPDRESLLSGALLLASQIAAKSPVAVQVSKINLNYSRDHSVDESLDYMVSVCVCVCVCVCIVVCFVDLNSKISNILVIELI